MVRMPKAFRGRAYSSQYASQSQRSASGGARRRGVKYGRIARGIRTGGVAKFTETYALNSLAPNSGGVFAAQMSGIPQLADYSALYRTFRITSFEVILLPQTVVNTADGGTTAQPGHIAHSWDRSAEVAVPTAEVDVLNDNAVKLDLLTKPLRIKCASPKPRVAMAIPSTGGQVGVDLGRNNWLSFDDGSGIPHNGMPYWYTAATGSFGPNVYVKVSFDCRDPR